VFTEPEHREILEGLHLAFRGEHHLFVLGVADAPDFQEMNSFLQETLYRGEAPAPTSSLSPIPIPKARLIS
jgi:hypothetical protein